MDAELAGRFSQGGLMSPAHSPDQRRPLVTLRELSPELDNHRIIAELRAQLAESEERVRQLEDILQGKGWVLPPEVEVRLTPSQARMLALLAARELCSHEALFEASRGVGSHDNAGIKVVDVHISKMRNRLKGFGLGIRTVWGRGYQLDAATRAWLRGFNSEALAASAASAFLCALAGETA
ncbi:MAG: helix-turn-helix domain-containing protein [Hyphomonas sp.]|nr:helix-turn-helix domain-containing protein [Hyphomonas sp.]